MDYTHLTSPGLKTAVQTLHHRAGSPQELRVLGETSRQLLAVRRAQEGHELLETCDGLGRNEVVHVRRGRGRWLLLLLLLFVNPGFLEARVDSILQKRDTCGVNEGYGSLFSELAHRECLSLPQWLSLIHI